jgi:hypothetical protein
MTETEIIQKMIESGHGPIEQAARRLRICLRTAYHLCRTGKLRAEKGAGGAWEVMLPTKEPVLTPQGLAGSMDYTPRHVQRLITKKVIAAIEIGHLKRIPRSEAVKLMMIRLGI